MSFGRTVMVDTEIGGAAIAAGTPINLVVGAANRDPSRWSDPAEFDIFRPAQPHLAFGTGPHVCLGIHFGRMEVRVAMERLLDRLPGLRFAPGTDDVHISGLGARSPMRLPVVFGTDTPAARGGTTTGE